jgi:hypothetical protein
MHCYKKNMTSTISFDLTDKVVLVTGAAKGL